jgi:short-subunit dehydrogenase
MNERASRKKVLITGSSRGLGRHIAMACAGRGYDLALVSRDRDALTGLKNELEAAHPILVNCYPCDLAEPGAAQACALQVAEDGAVPDVLVNNAGIGWWRPFLDHNAEEHDRMIDLNLRSVIHLTHALLPLMVERGSGHIINIASDLADRPLGKMAVYTATKYALRGFSLSLSQEVRPHGIKVSLLSPGMIDTSFHGSGEGSLDELAALKPGPLAQLVLNVMEQPGHQLIDEITVHASGQDY